MCFVKPQDGNQFSNLSLYISLSFVDAQNTSGKISI